MRNAVTAILVLFLIAGFWFSFNSGYGGNYYNSYNNYGGYGNYMPHYTTVSYPMNNYYSGYAGNYYYNRPFNSWRW